jgi:hypothetical protein
MPMYIKPAQMGERKEGGKNGIGKGVKVTIWMRHKINL